MTQATVKSAARVLQVLEYFEQVREPLSLKRISDALGYPQSSTTVLLKNLITLGYLNYNRAERVYFPTPRVASLGGSRLRCSARAACWKCCATCTARPARPRPS